MSNDIAFTDFLNASPFLLILAVMTAYGLYAKLEMRRRSLMTEAIHPLENLVPLTTLDLDETGYWRRAYWSCAFVFGTGLLIPEFQTHTISQFSPVETLLLNATAGLTFALLFAGSFRGRLRLSIAKLYVGDRMYIDPPPQHLMARYQIPCRMTQGNAVVPGVLYVGSRGLLFVTQKGIVEAEKNAMIPAESVVFSLGEPIRGKNWLWRFFVPRPQTPIEMSWNGSSGRLYVSRPAASIERIRGCMDSLKHLSA